MFESHVVTSVDRTSFDFRFEDFFSNLPLQIFMYCVTDQPSITPSLFQEWWAAWWSLCWMRKDVSIKGLHSRILIYCVWPWCSTWKIQEQHCYHSPVIHSFFAQVTWTNGWKVKTGSSEFSPLMHSLEYPINLIGYTICWVILICLGFYSVITSEIVFLWLIEVLSRDIPIPNLFLQQINGISQKQHVAGAEYPPAMATRLPWRPKACSPPSAPDNQPLHIGECRLTWILAALMDGFYLWNTQRLR